jgi:hypothetical protein
MNCDGPHETTFYEQATIFHRKLLVVSYNLPASALRRPVESLRGPFIGPPRVHNVRPRHAPRTAP